MSPSTKRPASPFGQNPMSSICISDTTVNGSYTVRTSTSAGVRPAIANAGGALNTCGVLVKSRCWLQCVPLAESPSATPRTTAGGCGRSCARSTLVVT